MSDLIMELELHVLSDTQALIALMHFGVVMKILNLPPFMYDDSVLEFSC